MPTVRVELGPRSYDLVVAPGALAQVGARVAALSPSRVLVLTHPAIARLHGEALLASFPAPRPEVVLVPAGERQKSLRRAGQLYDELLARGMDRQSVVITLGGGVIGDLGGFVAATYMRGMRYVQAPTTLLAQVDASVGGKVAVDHPQAKNLIGAFHQPHLVVADVAVLGTLPARDYRSGLAEVVKHGVIADPALFAWMEGSLRALAARDPEATTHVVVRSGEIKAAVVGEDERESGRRAILNFGHTVAHALESLTQYRRWRHGEAVAIGMVAAARLSAALGRCDRALPERIERLLAALRLPTRIEGLSAEAILAAMQSDKKAIAGAVRFVLVREMGQVEVAPEAPRAALRQVLIALGAD